MVVSSAVDPMGLTWSSVEAKDRLLQEEVEAVRRNDKGASKHLHSNPAPNALRFTTPVQPTRPPGSVVGGFGLPNLSTIWSESSSGITVVHNAEFTIIQKAFESYLRFLVLDRPQTLERYITDKEWTALRNKMDQIGMRVRWDVNRSLFLVIIVFVMVVIVNLGDEIGGSFSLGDGQQCVLIVLGIILLKLVFDECYENCTRRYVLHEMDEACREYSNMLRPRGVCIAFRFEDNDDHGLVVDLIFYRVKSTEEKILEIL